jgi:hypothetical protein
MGDQGRDLQKQEQAEIVDGEYREAPIRIAERSERGLPEPPLHSLSSLVTIAIDGLWSVPEFVSMATVAGLPALPVLAVGSAVTCMAAVTLLQRFVSKDTWGSAVAKGFAMGVIAGVPFPFTGTAAGSVLLLWTGAHAIFNRKQLPPG